MKAFAIYLITTEESVNYQINRIRVLGKIYNTFLFE